MQLKRILLGIIYCLNLHHTYGVFFLFFLFFFVDFSKAFDSIPRFSERNFYHYHALQKHENSGLLTYDSELFA